jgi:hypothetical protein
MTYENYSLKLAACSEEEKDQYIDKYGEPSVIVPQFRSEMNAELERKGIANPFNDQPQYEEDEDGVFEKPCMWLIFWK